MVFHLLNTGLKTPCVLLIGLCLFGVSVQSLEAEIVDVYILGGQSNMQGVGRSQFLTPQQIFQPEIQLYHSSGVVSSAGANTLTTLRPAGWGGVSGGFGPEIGFGEQLAALQPNASIAIIKHAAGGTSLANDWNPGANASDTGNFGPQFNAFVNTVNAGLAAITAAGDFPIIRGMLWHQGEEDSKFSSMANAYEANISHLVDRVREQWNVVDMPFVLANVLPDPVGVGPGDIALRFPFRNTVRQSQSNVDRNSGVVSAKEGVTVVSTDEFQLHGEVIDGFRDTDFVHLNYSGQLSLGHQYAEAISEYYPENILGDLTGDDQIQADDWVQFRSVLHTAITATTRSEAEDQGDFNFDLQVNQYDFLVFKEAFITANSEAAFSELVTSVPEPSSVVLVCFVLVCVVLASHFVQGANGINSSS